MTLVLTTTNPFIMASLQDNRAHAKVANNKSSSISLHKYILNTRVWSWVSENYLAVDRFRVNLKIIQENNK